MSFISLYIPFNVEINSLTTAILGTIFPTISLTLFKKDDILVSMSFLSFISVWTISKAPHNSPFFFFTKHI